MSLRVRFPRSTTSNRSDRQTAPPADLPQTSGLAVKAIAASAPTSLSSSFVAERNHACQHRAWRSYLERLYVDSSLQWKRTPPAHLAPREVRNRVCSSCPSFSVPDLRVIGRGSNDRRLGRWSRELERACVLDRAQPMIAWRSNIFQLYVVRIREKRLHISL